MDESWDEPLLLPWSESALIEEVRQRRILWDHTHPNYYRRDLQLKDWTAVAAVFGDDYDAEYCKSEFARLKENRRKRKGRAKDKKKSGSKGQGTQHNFQTDQLAFLDDVGKDLSHTRESNLTRRKTVSDETENEEDVDDVEAADNGVAAHSIQLGSNGVRNCCEEVHDVNERIAQERELRHAPLPRHEPQPLGGGIPSATSSPAITAASGLMRIRRNVHAPIRFSPSHPSPKKRPRRNDLLNASMASTASNASNRSTRSASSAGRRRRGGGALSFQVDALDPIYEQSTQDSQSQDVTSNEVTAQVHRGADQHQSEELARNDTVRHNRSQPSIRDSPISRIFSPHVIREASDVEQHGMSTPVSAAARRRRRSRFWVDPPGADDIVQDAEEQSHARARPPPQVQQGQARTQSAHLEHGRNTGGHGGRNARGHTRAEARRIAAEERLLQQREVQMIHEQRRERLREATRLQAEAARRLHNAQNQPQQNAEVLQDTAEIALMKQYLSDKDMDYFGHFGQTVAGMMRSLPANVSSKGMVVILDFVHKLMSSNEEERQDFLNSNVHLA